MWSPSLIWCAKFRRSVLHMRNAVLKWMPLTNFLMGIRINNG
nr:MAG TPA: hypothetical protein [Caudoviricetes sp.]